MSAAYTLYSRGGARRLARVIASFRQEPLTGRRTILLGQARQGGRRRRCAAAAGSRRARNRALRLLGRTAPGWRSRIPRRRAETDPRLGLPEDGAKGRTLTATGLTNSAR